MTPEQLDAIRADLDRRVPARDLADRDHCRALLAEVERLRAHIERNGIRWCMCSPADRMNERRIPRCPYHGDGMAVQRNLAEQERDEARAERDRLAAALDQVRVALAGHPRCERYDGDDPIACGWKKDVLDVQAAIEGTDS